MNKKNNYKFDSNLPDPLLNCYCPICKDCVHKPQNLDEYSRKNEFCIKCNQPEEYYSHFVLGNIKI
ncbi:MAG: hypothetical protein ACD_58C00330G0007 [uncultured bacterium]|nr:MAG: hypothetical protein ACD_58C00330G0007 [uncultured bacterium]